jgi:hypothetical protein
MLNIYWKENATKIKRRKTLEFHSKQQRGFDENRNCWALFVSIKNMDHRNALHLPQRFPLNIVHSSFCLNHKFNCSQKWFIAMHYILRQEKFQGTTFLNILKPQIQLQPKKWFIAIHYILRQEKFQWTTFLNILKPQILLQSKILHYIFTPRKIPGNNLSQHS